MQKNVEWMPKGWNDYLEWQSLDMKTVCKINELIKDAQRNPFKGIGQPEALVGDLKGYWSRRINHKDRLVYAVENDKIVILSCKRHYK